jgi:hypothetical protein
MSSINSSDVISYLAIARLLPVCWKRPAVQPLTVLSVLSCPVHSSVWTALPVLSCSQFCMDRPACPVLFTVLYGPPCLSCPALSCSQFCMDHPVCSALSCSQFCMDRPACPVLFTVLYGPPCLSCPVLFTVLYGPSCPVLCALVPFVRMCFATEQGFGVGESVIIGYDVGLSTPPY